MTDKPSLKDRLKAMKNVPAPKEKPKKNPKLGTPPTKKQLNWLRQLGYRGPIPKTKGHAGLLIAKHSRR